MARLKEKSKALKLRREGKSIKEIAKKLNIAKSSVSVWCRNIRLTPEQIKKLAAKQLSGSYKGRMKFLERIRRERMEEVARLREEGLRGIGKISKRDFFIAGIAMYWSEGTTSPSGEEVSFSNSDPKMILFMLKWFKEACGVSNNKLTLQIRINKIHKSRVKKIENYWSKLTGIPSDQFTKTILIKTKSKKIYPNSNAYFGTLRIMVHQGTQLRRKINGWIEGLAKLPA